MTDTDYESTEEAWQSGYNAALSDMTDQMIAMRPWWVLRKSWRRVTSRVWAMRALNTPAKLRGFGREPSDVD